MTMIPCQFTSPERDEKNCGRTALYTLRKASLTVEASVVLPVFLLAMLMLLGIIDLCRLKTEHQAELVMQAKELSMYAYLTPELYRDDYVDLYTIEAYELPVKLFPFPDLKLAFRARIHTWTGRSDTDSAVEENDFGSDTAVYVSERETVYHTNAECTHLDLSIMQTNAGSLDKLRNAYGEAYHPCEKCCGTLNGEWSHPDYYVTDHGNTYHVSKNCSSLKRTTKLVQLKDVTHLEECERCRQMKSYG